MDYPGGGTEKRHGEPAFPVFPESSTGHAAAFRGMSLRDWFAGQALAGLLAADHIATDWGVEEAAQEAYIRADAMLVARESEG